MTYESHTWSKRTGKTTVHVFENLHHFNEISPEEFHVIQFLCKHFCEKQFGINGSYLR